MPDEVGDQKKNLEFFFTGFLAPNVPEYRRKARSMWANERKETVSIVLSNCKPYSLIISTLFYTSYVHVGSDASRLPSAAYSISRDNAGRSPFYSWRFPWPMLGPCTCSSPFETSLSSRNAQRVQTLPFMRVLRHEVRDMIKPELPLPQVPTSSYAGRRSAFLTRSAVRSLRGHKLQVLEVTSR